MGPTPAPRPAAAAGGRLRCRGLSSCSSAGGWSAFGAPAGGKRPREFTGLRDGGRIERNVFGLGVLVGLYFGCPWAALGCTTARSTTCAGCCRSAGAAPGRHHWRRSPLRAPRRSRVCGCSRCPCAARPLSGQLAGAGRVATPARRHRRATRPRLGQAASTESLTFFARAGKGPTPWTTPPLLRPSAACTP